MDRWSVPFEVDGVSYEAHFSRRPFREGCEVTVQVGDEVIRLGDLGLGEQALIERLRGEIRVRVARSN